MSFGFHKSSLTFKGGCNPNSVKYIELKEAIATAEQRHGIHELDFLSREILQKIAAANLKKQSVRVSSISEGNGFGTMPTLLARLTKLVDGGWIERVDDPEDARAVLLEITPKTKSIFRKISNALEEY